MASEYDLVTLDEVRAGLRIEDAGGDSPDDDAVRLEIFTTAASQAILSYLKETGVASFVDTGGLPILEEVPAKVKAATILLIQYYFDGYRPEDFAHGTLPFPVTVMIYQMRDPALA